MIQLYLSKGQALPILGPLVVSPVKIAVSTVEIITGIALSIFFEIRIAILNKIFNIVKWSRENDESKAADRETNKAINDYAEDFRSLKKAYDESTDLALSGIDNLFYACINIATAGIAGAYLEYKAYNSEGKYEKVIDGKLNPLRFVALAFI